MVKRIYCCLKSSLGLDVSFSATSKNIHFIGFSVSLFIFLKAKF